VLLQRRLGELAHFQADDFQALVFKARENLADQGALDGIGFEQDERAFQFDLRAMGEGGPRPGSHCYGDALPQEKRSRVADGVGAVDAAQRRATEHKRGASKGPGEFFWADI
jgi:hypothetical protein